MATKAKKKVRKKKNNLLMIAVSFAIFLFLSVIGGYFALLYAGDRMIEQNVQKLQDLKAEPTVIYDKNGKEMTSLIRQKNRVYKPINEMPKTLINAFLAVEDKRFYEHKGVDMVRIGGAIVNDIKKGSLAEGGSTITQQLARNVFLTLDQTFWRKTKEMSIAIGLERKYSKDQILEMYLNRVYLGEGEFGVEDAAQYYFGKSVSDENFTVAEAAMLAAIPKAPTTYSPFNNPEKAKLRRDTVIRLMHEQGIITDEQKEAAQAEPLPKEPHEVAGASLKKGYRAFFDNMVEESEAKFGVTEEELYRGGWNIYTTFDPKVQDAMVEEYANAKNFPKDGAKRGVESSMIVIDAKTGGIAGMMGGRNYAPKGFNYATDMKRQPGSSFKPIAVFAPAVNKDINKWNSNSQLSNKRQSFNGYEPRNYNNRYTETMSMNRAMIDSANIPPVWLLNEIGVPESLEYLKKVGIELTPNDRNLAIALGGLSVGTSPLEMAQAYTPFVNGGVVSETHSITKVENKDEGVVREYKPKQTEALKPEAAWEIHTMLERAVQEGTGKAARISGRHVAGKTGTTQSIAGDSKANKDAWFVGYTPEYVGAVWMGFDPEDKQHLMHQGSSMTAQMFSKVLATALKGVPSSDFVRPAGAVEHKEVEVEPELQMAADMSLDPSTNKLMVVLSWIGGADGNTYDLYRISENGERQLISAGMKETSYVDVLDSPKQYRYQVVPRNAQGEEGTPSKEVPIDSKKLENMLNGDPGHNEEGNDQGQNPGGTENGNGENPPDQGTGEAGEHTNNGDGGQSPNPGTGEVPPDIVNPDPSQTNGSSNEIQLPPPPQEEGQNQFPDASNG
ncbi:MULTISPECIES: PBP1A family penicillin-binding protein [Brevibacillus]|uniref:PBP1A family penicillin-binding protein n=1 Tax=Brevibacillus brevis TaxID=1393 RepID=A0A2Z4MM34_BREBE|nr:MULTISPECIES: PBP1A family penicillin-binding protein [Brevibacillus]AWX57565.1 PBP1A family penicillin-binding protein [Brevibacillus brevis]NRR21853.1 PBP1A family penicillin-binding protein [Brevibacillus sp. MS2.2]